MKEHFKIYSKLYPYPQQTITEAVFFFFYSKNDELRGYKLFKNKK